MTGFTKGPWGVSSIGFIRTGADGDGYAVASVYGENGNPASDDVTEENTNLIAAAPDLYEALSDCIDIIETEAAQFYHSPAVDAAKQALAKARGEA